MSKFRKTLVFILSLLVCILITGCGEVVPDEDSTTATEELGKNEVYIYYVNKDTSKFLVDVEKVSNINNTNGSINEIMNFVMTSNESKGYKTAITNNLMFKEVEFKDGVVTVYFDLVDNAWTVEEALFAKACVVKSIVQLETVDIVNISINDLLNKEDDAITIESFDAESFVSVDSDDSGYTQTGNITIYFADENGEQLKEYYKKVEITNNVSLEQIVMESLITGPLRDGYKGTIPDGVEVNKISVKDGVCYIDLNDSFNGSIEGIRSDLTVYSVVNSLIELPTISKVQFFINGEKQDYYRETMEFSGTFEFNSNILNPEDSSEASTTETGSGVEGQTSSEIIIE